MLATNSISTRVSICSNLDVTEGSWMSTAIVHSFTFGVIGILMQEMYSFFSMNKDAHVTNCFLAVFA